MSLVPCFLNDWNPDESFRFEGATPITVHLSFNSRFFGLVVREGAGGEYKRSMAISFRSVESAQEIADWLNSWLADNRKKIEAPND